MHSRASRTVSLVHAEAVAVLVADRAKDPSRVVDERAVVQDPDSLRLEVGAAPERVDELADRVALQRHRHCVDREVAAVEVLVDRPGLDRREHGGRVVRLAAGRDDVDPSVVAVEDDGGAERAVRPDAPVELLGERRAPRRSRRLRRRRRGRSSARRAGCPEPCRRRGRRRRYGSLTAATAPSTGERLSGSSRVATGAFCLRPRAGTGTDSPHSRHRHARISSIRSHRGGGRGYQRVKAARAMAGRVRPGRSLRSRRARRTEGPRSRSSTAPAAWRRPAPHRRSSSPGSRRATSGRPSSSRSGRARFRPR